MLIKRPLVVAVLLLAVDPAHALMTRLECRQVSGLSFTEKDLVSGGTERQRKVAGFVQGIWARAVGDQAKAVCVFEKVKLTEDIRRKNLRDFMFTMEDYHLYRVEQ